MEMKHGLLMLNGIALLSWCAKAQDVLISPPQVDRLSQRIERSAAIHTRMWPDDVTLEPHLFFEADAAQGSYRAGLGAIDKHDYTAAIAAMQRVVDAKTHLADAATYWKAYAQLKLGRSNDALASLAELHKQFPGSSWLNDAKALELEARTRAGHPVSPDTVEDEDLKLLAIGGLMRSDPGRATPLVEKVVSDPNNAPQLRARALFVLARSDSPDARRTVSEMAKGSANPELQAKALEYMAATDSGANGPMFAEAYQRSTDAAVKRAALNALFMRKDTNDLLAIAKAETNPMLQRESVLMLGMAGGAAQLVSLYNSSSSEALKRSVLDSLTAQGAAASLVEIARRETNPTLKKLAVERLSAMNDKAASDYMMELLK
jgi:hypothetical protein